MVNLDHTMKLNDNGMMISWMDTDEDVGTFEILVSKDTDRVHSEMVTFGRTSLPMMKYFRVIEFSEFKNLFRKL